MEERDESEDENHVLVWLSVPFQLFSVDAYILWHFIMNQNLLPKLRQNFLLLFEALLLNNQCHTSLKKTLQ